MIGFSQVALLCARIVRADDLFTADQKIYSWAPLLEIRNQATLCPLEYTEYIVYYYARMLFLIPLSYLSTCH